LLRTELMPARRAPLLFLAANCSRNSDPAASLRLGSEVIALGRSLGDDEVIALGLQITGNTQAWSQPEAGLLTSDETFRTALNAGVPWWAMAALLDKSWAYFWLGRVDEARPLVADALRQSLDRYDLWAEVLCRVSSSVLETYGGCPATALEEAGTLVRRCTELGSPTFACWGERHRAEAYIYLGDNRARDALARARALAESVDDAFNLACADTTEGLLQVSVGRDDLGYPLIEAGISKLESFGFARMCVRDRAVLSEVALRRGDLGTARSHLEAAAWRLPRTADPEGVPILRAEARYARAQGSSRRAHGLACDGLEAAASSGQRLWAIDLLELVAITASDLSHHAEAARLLGAAEAQRALTGYAVWAPARDELEPALHEIESVLGSDAFQRTLAEGRALSLEDAVAYAYRGRGSHIRAVSGWDSLTPAERRVVSLVVDGLTNSEIAEQLFVSTATVKSHLTRVFEKLGVANRSRLARLAKTHLSAVGDVSGQESAGYRSRN
jgi:DNA-binding CsgD family transcriptional regulator